MKNQIKTLVITFKNELKQAEIGRFRGAVIAATENAGVLFHNHLEDEKFRYSYPLIQYKRNRKRAAIVCVGEGTEAIGDFFSSCNFEIEIGERPVLLEVDAVKASQTV